MLVRYVFLNEKLPLHVVELPQTNGTDVHGLAVTMTTIAGPGATNPKAATSTAEWEMEVNPMTGVPTLALA